MVPVRLPLILAACLLPSARSRAALAPASSLDHRAPPAYQIQVPVRRDDLMGRLFQNPEFGRQIGAAVNIEKGRMLLLPANSPVWAIATERLPPGYSAGQSDAVEQFVDAFKEGLYQLQATAHRAMANDTPIEELPGLAGQLRHPAIQFLNKRQQGVVRFSWKWAANRLYQEKRYLLPKAEKMIEKSLMPDMRHERLEQIRSDPVLREYLDDGFLSPPPGKRELQKTWSTILFPGGTVFYKGPSHASGAPGTSGPRNLDADAPSAFEKHTREAKVLVEIARAAPDGDSERSGINKELERLGIRGRIPEVRRVGVDFKGDFWMELLGIEGGEVVGSPLWRSLDMVRKLDMWIRFTKIFALVHARDWVHGDIKPKNLVFNDHLVMPVDWDAAVRKNDSPVGATTFFQPPEDGPYPAETGVRTPLTDIYSLGKTLEMLYEGILEGVLYKNSPAYEAEISDEELERSHLGQLIRQMTAPLTVRWPRSMADLADALEGVRCFWQPAVASIPLGMP